MKTTCLCLALATGALLGDEPAKAISFQEKPCAGKTLLQIENPYYRISLFPASGGRIVSWFDKVKAMEMAFGGIPGERDYHLLGGMLDDRRDMSNVPYQHRTLGRTDSELSLELSGKSPDGAFAVVKTLTFHADSPVVNVRLKHSNLSGRQIEGFALGERNFIIPGGKPRVAKDEDRYFIPTTHGVRRLNGYTVREIGGHAIPEFAGRELQTAMAAPWSAFIDRKRKQGFGVHMADSSYLGWYMWKDLVDQPTYEWLFKDLPAGHSRTSEFDMIQIDDMPGVAFVSPSLLADIQVSDGRVASVLRPLVKIGKAQLVTSVKQIGGQWEFNPPPRGLEALEANHNTHVEQDLKLPGPGLYRIDQKLVDGQDVLASWHDSFATEGIATQPMFEMPELKSASAKPIPGWQGVKDVEIVKDETAERRGFMVSRPAEYGPLKELDKLKISLGVNERRSVPLTLQPLSGREPKITVSATDGDKAGLQLFIEWKEEFDTKGYGLQSSRLLLPLPSEALQLRESMNLWLRLGTGALQPGNYALELSFSDGANRKTLPVEVSVLEVPLPQRPLISLEAEGYPMYDYPGCKLRERRPGMLDCWLSDMTSHGVDTFQRIGELDKPLNYSLIKLAGTGTSLADDMKNRPGFYAEAKEFPELDLSAFDYYFDSALRHGMVCFSMVHWSTEKPSPFVKHIYRQAQRYLCAKGYQPNDLFVKILDEMPSETFPAMAETAKWLKEDCGFRPFSTFYQLFDQPENLRKLQPYFDMYQGGYTTREAFRSRAGEGLVKPDDRIGHYTGGGTMTQSYENMSLFGWQCLAFNFTIFNNHEYMRGGNARKGANIVLIGEDGKPIDSVAFEGLRDGFECANYGMLYRQWRDIMKDEPPMGKKWDAAFDAIVGGKDALLPVEGFAERGVEMERLAKATPRQLDEAHDRLLALLADFGAQAKQLKGKYAKAQWAGVEFFGPASRTATAAASGLPAEAKAAAAFEKSLRDALSIPDDAYNSRPAKVKLTFRLEPDRLRMPYSYQIERKSPTEIAIVGSSEEGLVLGGGNLVKAMRISGTWPTVAAAAFKANAKTLRPSIVDGGDAEAKKFFLAKMEAITGQKMDGRKGGDSIDIHIGKTDYVAKLGLDFKNLHPRGYYIIFKDGRNLVLCGGDAHSTLYAVNDFLKRFCGYRHFYPGPGEIIPKMKEIDLPGKIEIKAEPDIKSYTVPWLGAEEGFARSTRTICYATHSFSNIIPPEIYGKTHPEYYCMINGKRFVPSKECRDGTWQPCISNPDLVRIASDYADAWFAKNPDHLSVPAGVNDGGGDCQCQNCLELDRKYGNRYVPFYNAMAKKVAERHPGKYVAFIAYGRCCMKTPVNIKLEPNVIVEVCGGLRGNMAEMRKWSDAGAGLGLYDYLYTFGGGYAVPRYYPHVMGKAWKEAFNHYNLKSMWTELYPSSMVFDAPRQYVLNELAWDMDANIDALLDDYFSKMYGEAAAPMRDFFDRFETVYGRRGDPLRPGDDWRRPNQLDDYTLEDVEYLDKCLDKAKAVVKDEDATKRLRLLGRLYELSRCHIESAACTKALDAVKTVASDKDVTRIISLAELALKDIQSIGDYTLSAEEERAVFYGEHKLKEFKADASFSPETMVENSVDNAFDKITAWLVKDKGWAGARLFWMDLAMRNQPARLKPLALTQVYTHEATPPNLVENPGFEPADKAKLADKDWATASLAQKRGWCAWHFQQSNTVFLLDDEEPHSGSHSAGIGENQISGCFLTAIPVDPSCRYRLSFWVKRNAASPSGGSMSIRFKDRQGGWVDDGTSVMAKYPEASAGTWAKVEMDFTPLPNSSYAQLLFSAPTQGSDAKIWFDDISATKIYDPTYFGEVKPL